MCEACDCLDVTCDPPCNLTKICVTVMPAVHSDRGWVLVLGKEGIGIGRKLSSHIQPILLLLAGDGDKTDMPTIWYSLLSLVRACVHRKSNREEQK